MVDLAQVQEFFFKGMVGGWAAGAKKIMIPEMPGFRAIKFREGDFRLLDCWSKTENSTKSFGTTTIWFRDIPAWIMNHGGLYDERAIAFLKRVLRQNYEAGEFVGGRGPLVFAEGLLRYTNYPRHNDFHRFDGRENVFSNETGTFLGYHDYWGMSLL